jgi:malonyl-CoA/methylmalonyl-CoA synthetase
VLDIFRAIAGMNRRAFWDGSMGGAWQSSVALVEGDGTRYTYDDLQRAARHVAAALIDARTARPERSRGDLEEARVAYMIEPGFGYAAVQQGIWQAGGVAVPLALSHPAKELAYTISDAQVSCVIAEDRFVDALRPVAAFAGATVLRLPEAMATPPATMLPDLSPSRRAMILYTSGTTGKAKGVVTTHANVRAQVDALVTAWQWTAEDHLLLVLPMHHLHGILNGLLSALGAGATCEMHPRFDAMKAWDRFASGDVTVFTAVPTIYHRLIAAWDAASADVRRRWSAGAGGVRLMMSGSAALPVGTLVRWREITGHTMLERYGMTETGMVLANPFAGERRHGFVGTPLPGVEVRIVDEHGMPVPPGTAGELEVRGPSVTHEYWRRPEETREAFRDGWFRTGDVAVVEQGSYRLLGRASVDIIKTGGYKVSAVEIEEVLRNHPAVAECAVVGVSDVEWGQRVMAAVELREGAALTLDDLQAWARERLAPYKVPRAMRVFASLPRNAMGKIVKGAIAR